MSGFLSKYYSGHGSTELTARWGWPLVRLALFLACFNSAIISWAQTVYINEAQSSNGHALRDEDGDAADWLELFNSGSQAINLSGYGLSDSGKTPFKWIFPDTIIEPGSMLTVFASGKDRRAVPDDPISPDSLAGLVGWLKADSISTSDGSQVRLEGNSLFVSQWPDVSSLNSPAQQATPNRQPQWLAEQANGYPALHFDGDDDVLARAIAPATNNFCVIIVARTQQTIRYQEPNSASLLGLQGQHFVLGAALWGGTIGGAGLSFGANGIGVYEHGLDYFPPLATYEGPIGTNFTVVSFNYQNRTPSLYSQSYVNRKGLVSLRSEVLMPFEIGWGSSGGFAGEVAEIVMYNRTLSEAERQGVERYLATKYALPLPMPRHTNFRLNAQGGSLRLTRPDGNPEDKIQLPAMPRDVSYGRQPDGSSTLAYFTNATPNASNDSLGTPEWVSHPAFSYEGGFYRSDFPLAITTVTPGVTIHYTLDGSEPTELSPIYESPVWITHREGTANGISTNATTPEGAGWIPPMGEVFKGWVVRAKGFKSGALPSTVATRFYWVTPEGRARYSLPVVSLATDPANLFDPQFGIYIPGLGENYSQAGPEWERPVHVALYDSDNSLAFAQDGGVSIHGNTSQYQPIKALDIDGHFGAGHDSFHYPLFPDRARNVFSHFLLRPSGQDQTFTFMRDELTQSLAAETGAETQGARPCILFINGEYWGVNYLKEKEDNEFVSYYSGLPTDELEYLENYAAPILGDVGMYWSLINFLSAGDLAATNAYAEALQYLQTTNYMDFKILETHSYRWDIGGAQRLWRPRNDAGRFRWLHFDYDVAWGGFGAFQPAWEFNMIHSEITPDESLYGHNTEPIVLQFRQLLKIEGFRNAFLTRYADLLNSLLSPGHIIQRIDALAGVLTPEMPEHIARWGWPSNYETWQDNVQYLRDYATARPEFARQQLVNEFGLGGTYTLTLSQSDTNIGLIKLNSLEVNADANAPWKGVYFAGIPIEITASPQPGALFVRWSGPGSSNLADPSQPSAVLQPASDLALEAVFRREIEPQITRCRWIGEGMVELLMAGEAGQTWELQTSVTMRDWEGVQAFTFGKSQSVGITFLEYEKTNTRFFRLVKIP